VINLNLTWQFCKLTCCKFEQFCTNCLKEESIITVRYLDTKYFSFEQFFANIDTPSDDIFLQCEISIDSKLWQFSLEIRKDKLTHVLRNLLIQNNTIKL
jgi:hypothetical protein